MAAELEFRQVDVFTDVPFTGNGLIVLFGSTAEVGARALISLTAEMRQFELIVADFQPEVGRVSARIFTAEEELPFAGHPVIGAAAALHERFTAGEPARSWVFVIAGREITVRSRRTAVYYEAEMDQGSPTLDPPLGQQDAAWFARALKFVYLFEPDKREGRSWDNTGAVEDVATGSAAGPAAAFLAAHGLAAQDETIGVGATSSASAWAVGFSAGATRGETLILHWNGRTWTRVASPNPGGASNKLWAVAAASASNAWVVGSFSDNTQALAFHCC